MSQPDHQSPLGRTVRALEISESALSGRCGCPKRRVSIVCMLFQEGGCAERQAAGVCQCCRTYAPCRCFKRPARFHERGKVAWPEWVALLYHFDPEGYSDPPPPKSPAVAVSHRARVNLYDERHGKDADKPAFGLFHPDDLLEDESVGIAGELGRRQGSYQTPTLTPAEARLLRILERRVWKACLVWGSWGKVSKGMLADAGRALAAIMRRRLYREVGATFRDYYRRLGLQAQDVDHLFASAGLEIREPRVESVPFASVFEVKMSPRQDGPATLPFVRRAA